MKKIISCLILLACFSTCDAQKDSPCLYADIVVLSDFSGTIKNNEHVVTSSVAYLVDSIPPIDNKIRFALVSFADDTQVEVELTSDYKTLLSGVKEYSKRAADSHHTYIVSALDTAASIFDRNRTEYSRYRIIIIISDGDFHDDEAALLKAESMRNRYGFIIIALSAYPQYIPPESIIINSVPSPSIPNEVYVKNLEDISGGAYFGRDLKSLRNEIRKRGLCL